MPFFHQRRVAGSVTEAARILNREGLFMILLLELSYNCAHRHQMCGG